MVNLNLVVPLLKHYIKPVLKLIHTFTRFVLSVCRSCSGCRHFLFILDACQPFIFSEVSSIHPLIICREPILISNARLGVCIGFLIVNFLTLVLFFR